MSSVHLISAAPVGAEGHPKAHHDLDQMRAAARADRFGEHHVVDDPAAAELILFVETSTAAGAYFELVRRHPIYRARRQRCYLFSSTDRVVPFIPGVFASIEKRWYWPAWTRSGHYLGVREGGALTYDPERAATRLFCFLGSTRTHRVRRQVMSLDGKDGLLLDTHAEEREAKPVTPEQFESRYADAIFDSKFVLCPRGGGASTFRVFETMMLGRVPVVISDQWVPPAGPDWDSCSLRVAEDQVASIPELLEAEAPRAERMGRLAREEWLEWFAPEVTFHRIVEQCLSLEAAASRRAGLRATAPHLQMLRPFHSARAVARRARHGRAAATHR